MVPLLRKVAEGVEGDKLDAHVLSYNKRLLLFLLQLQWCFDDFLTRTRDKSSRDDTIIFSFHLFGRRSPLFKKDSQWHLE